jgi:hypothetical protein
MQILNKNRIYKQQRIINVDGGGVFHLEDINKVDHHDAVWC